VQFDGDAIKVERNREELRVPVVIDIGFGDAHPHPTLPADLISLSRSLPILNSNTINSWLQCE
jgi:hypothetical protein